MNNKTIMQYFEWYLPADCTLWYKLKNDAENLKNIGITEVWLPPAYKAAGGVLDTGYAVYDLYDLGEFNQRGTVPTKYGIKDQYIEAINQLHNNNINVIADIVFNQKMGADEVEDVIAIKESKDDRNVDIEENITIKAWTKFTFPGRNNAYSDFQWNWTHFHGVDWDENTKQSGIYRFYGKHWDKNVDDENGNFDYLMGADVDLNNVDVVDELINWTKWYINTCNIDGFRLDAIKHMRADFYKQWLEEINQSNSKQFFTVGEYWKNDVNCLKKYLEEVENKMSLFDIPLHYNLYNASNSSGNYNMGAILDNTLVKENPEKAVTFVDNHDTEIGQALESSIQDWFKPLAYALILLRNTGTPCVFYGDYYGINKENTNSFKEIINTFLLARQKYCYGKQNDYFDDQNIIGWTLEGDLEHTNSGMAVVMSDNCGGSKNMYIGKQLTNTQLYDITGNVKDIITIDENGNANFICNGGSVSVWIKCNK
jgi:alpha-amylase